MPMSGLMALPRILVVDDDAMMHRAVAAALRRLDDVTPVIEFAARAAPAAPHRPHLSAET